MTQAIINVNTVKSFVQEKEETKRHGSFVNSALQNFLNGFALILRANIGRNFVIDMGRFLILVFGVFLVIRSEITIGSLVFVFTISEKALISLYRISRLYDRIIESSDAIERLYDLFQEENDIINKKDGLKPLTIKGDIEFKGVTFIYRESGIKALFNVNLKIEAGSRIALVGPSGGGKTTIARMIYRHYDPTSGQVLLDGIDLREYDLFSFRKFIAIVPQEVDIFNMSIRDNIAYGNSKASMDEIREAARIANMEEFVNKINGGYDALVGERGLKLSGGQRQRLGIARAVLVKPRILIFDEATSNLDSQSERLIQDSMDKISQNRTVIIIAHRLSTIRRSDKIIVLENGKIVEQGTHKELVSRSSGLYRKLVSLQEMGDVEKDQD
jgi:ABC-type multidrug transport system fused ATPase/permease subunit